MKQCGKFASEKCIQAITFILTYLQMFIFRLHLNASSFMTSLCIQHLSLLFPGSLPHCFLLSVSELTSSPTLLLLCPLPCLLCRNFFPHYPHAHKVTPFYRRLQKGCSWFLLQATQAIPSMTDRVTDRQLASVQLLTHDSSLNFLS